MLLNVCCAPCGLPLLSIYPETVLFFYGPNIFPAEEYAKRRDEAGRAASIYGLKFIEGDCDHAAWLNYLKANLPQPPETYPENSERCHVCFKYRLEKTAEFARDNNFKQFASTLSVNRFKDTGFINDYGGQSAKKFGLEYVNFPIAAHDAHKAGLELSRKHNIYRQKYCGCEFSQRSALVFK